MDILCPNCKQTADLHTIDKVDYIECPKCGWFEVRADSTFVACDDPPGPEKKPEPSETKSRGSGPASTSEDEEPIKISPPRAIAPRESSSDEPGLDDSDDTGYEIEIVFED